MNRCTTDLRRVGLALLSVSALLLATPSAASAVSGSSGSSGAAGEPGAEVGSVAAVDWAPCAGLPAGAPPLECATYDVPLDYAHPTRGTVHLALDRLRATGPGRLGSLFLNPGGPGGSAAGFVAALAGSPVLSALSARYDLVGVDPRGVGASTPAIRCESPARTAARMDAAPATTIDVQSGLANGREYAASCQRQSGALLPYMGTGYAARDLDRVRAALGDRTFNYLGFSYGTYLGAVYADIFPGRVGRMVLDGAVDPFTYGQDSPGLWSLNYRASQASVGAFLDWCGGHPADCGFGGGHAREALRELTDRLQAHPLVSDGRGGHRVTNGYTVRDLLYLQTSAGRAAFPQTGQVLGALAAGRQVLANSDLASPFNASNIVIECTDQAGGIDPTTFASFAQRSRDLAPSFGPALVSGPPSYDGANLGTCANWPVQHPVSDWQGDFRAQGSDPVLVVGSVGDPSTPYAGAVALTATLDHARLLTERSGADATHTSYLYNSCMRGKVDAYLLRGTLPAVGTACAEEEPPLGAAPALLPGRLGPLT